jgi:hypothetical protein
VLLLSAVTLGDDVDVDKTGDDFPLSCVEVCKLLLFPLSPFRRRKENVDGGLCAMMVEEKELVIAILFSRHGDLV